MARRPLPRQTITASVIVAMLTVPLAAPPAMAGVDLLGGDDSGQDTSEGSSSEGDSDSSDDGEPSGDAQSNASSGSSEGDLGQALDDVVRGVTGGSDEQQAAADSQEPQEVTPQSQAEPQPAQPQPEGGSGGGGGGGSPAQPTAPQQSQPAASEAAPAPAQPAAPSGPQRAVRPGVNANGQPPATADSPSFDSSIDRGAYQPQAPEVFNETSDTRNENVAALPSIPLMGGAPDGEGAVVPNHLVAAACAVAVIIATAHSFHATRRLGPLRGRRT